MSSYHPAKNCRTAVVSLFKPCAAPFQTFFSRLSVGDGEEKIKNSPFKWLIKFVMEDTHRFKSCEEVFLRL